MKAAWARSSCRSLLQWPRMAAVAMSLFAVAGCATHVAGSSAINSIFDEATRRGISYYEGNAEQRIEALLLRDFPDGATTDEFVDHVTVAGGECLQDAILKPEADVVIDVCTYESHNYGVLGFTGALVYLEILNKWVIFVRSKGGVILSIEPSVKLYLTHLEESEYIERLDAQNAAELSQ